MMANDETNSAIKPPSLQIETPELDLSPPGTPEVSENQSPAYSDLSSCPTKIPNPKFSGQLSVKSCNSVRAIGTIPFGQLIVSPEQQESERSTHKLDRIAEEKRLQVAQSRSRCLEHGDIFRLLELPRNFIVGHDEIAFLTAKPGDDGFRDIAPGPHFLWVQQLSSRQEGDAQQLGDQHGPAPRCGYWYVTKQPGQIRVKQWDKYNEILGDVASQCEEDELKANLDSIYPTLRKYQLPGPSQHGKVLSGPFPATTQTSLWNQLTWAVSEPFLARVTRKRHVHEWLVDSSDCVNGDTHLSLYHSTASRAYKAAVSSELDFLFSQDFADLDLLDSRVKAQVADPTDTSSRVLTLLQNEQESITERDIIAELQFTYVTGTQLGNSACLEQWWELVLKIFLRSWDLIRLRPKLCREFLRTLHAQLIHTAGYVESPEENDRETTQGLNNEKPIFSTHLKNKRKLRRALSIYKRRLDETLLGLKDEVPGDMLEVGKAFEELEAWLWKYKWDLRSELVDSEPDGGSDQGDENDGDDDDDLPVVVELDENGRERGLVSFD
ncbi:AAR2 domain containing protein [Naviculisporaceae sp. PSN 640]